MSGSNLGSILAIVISFIVVIILSIALCHYFEKKAARARLENHIIHKKDRGKVLLPGIKQSNKLEN